MSRVSQRTRAKGKGTYDNIADLARDSAADPDTGERLANEINARSIVHFLFGMRSSKGISQSEMAKRLACSQSRISKLESGSDGDLTIGDLRKYVRALDHDLLLVICKSQWTLVEQVKFHACMIRNCLRRMIGLAERDSSIRNGVSRFHEEAFYNLVKLVLDSAKNVPQSSEAIPPIVEFEGEDCGDTEDDGSRELALSGS